MANYYKKNTGTNINLAASWSNVSPTDLTNASPWSPNTSNNHNYIWSSGSLGGTLDGNLNVGCITCQTNLTTAPTLTGSIGLYGAPDAADIYNSSGITHTTSNDDAWTFSGTISNNASNKWTIYRATANSVGVLISGTLSGGGDIRLYTAGANYAILSSSSTTSDFAGTLYLNNSTRYNTATASTDYYAGLGSGSYIDISGTGTVISSSVTNGRVNSFIKVNNSFTVGGATGFTSNVIFSNTIHFYNSSTLTTSVNTTFYSQVDTNTDNLPTGGTISAGAGSISITTDPSYLDSIGILSNNSIWQTTGAGSITMSAPSDVSYYNYFSGNNNTFRTASGAGSITMSGTYFDGNDTIFDAISTPIVINSTYTGISFTKTGANELRLSNINNSISGTITLSAGTLTLGSSSSIAPNQSANFLSATDPIININSSSATLRINTNAGTYVNNISGSGNVLVNSTSGGPTWLDNTISESIVTAYPDFQNQNSTYGFGPYASSATSIVDVVGSIQKLAIVLAGVSPTGILRYSADDSLPSPALNIHTISGASGTLTAKITPGNYGYAIINRDIDNIGGGSVILNLGSNDVSFSEYLDPYGHIINGIIKNTSGSIRLDSRLARNIRGTPEGDYWYLYGANSYSGATNVYGTSLYIFNGNGGATSSLGSSTSNATVTISSLVLNAYTVTMPSPDPSWVMPKVWAPGVLLLDNNINVNKSLSVCSLIGTSTTDVDSYVYFIPAQIISNGVNTLNFSSITTSSYVMLNISGKLTIPGLSNSVTTSSVWIYSPNDSTLSLSSSTISALSPFNIGYINIYGDAPGTTSPNYYGSNLTVEFQKIADAGVLSSFGNQSTATRTVGALIGIARNCDFHIGGSVTFKHIGNTQDTTNRRFYKNGSNALTIDSSGTGIASLTITGSMESNYSGSVGSNIGNGGTITFTGTNLNENIMSGTIVGKASALNTIIKSGTNRWVFSSVFTNITKMICNAGELHFTTNSKIFSSGMEINDGIVSANSVTISANTTIKKGTITAVLTGANTLTVTSDSTQSLPVTIEPDEVTASNTFTGNATINGYTKLLAIDGVNPSTSNHGKILGTSNTVTVGSTGVIATGNASNLTQRGQVRYNNLTFQSGSKLRLGFA